MNTPRKNPNLKHTLASAVAAFLILAPLATRSHAAEVYWGGGTGAITDDNWFSDTGLTTPVTRANADNINLASGTLFIVNAATVRDSNIGLNSGEHAAITVSGTWNNTAGELSIGNAAGSTGALTILTGGTVRASTFYVGNYGSGTFYLAEGAMLTNSANAWMARYAGGSGTATIDGKWDIGGYFQIGAAGTADNVLVIGETGSVNVTSNYLRVGGAAETSGSLIVKGLLNVDTNLAIGYAASTNVAIAAARGSLYIHESGTILAGAESGLGYLGIGSSGSELVSAYGEATIDGVLKVDNIFSVGRSGDGVLTLNSTGTITNTTGYVGRYYNAKAGHGHATGHATISGVWANSANFIVGDTGRGTLIVNEGGIVTVGGTAGIGNGATGSGTVTIAGLWQIAGDLGIGNAGTGVLDIQSGGSVVVGGMTVLGATSGNGTLRINGGILDTNRFAFGAGTATFLLNGGTLRAGTLIGNDTSVIDNLGSGLLILTDDSSAFAGTVNIHAGALVADGEAVKLGGQVNILDGAALDLRDGTLAATGNVNLADGAIWRYSLSGTHALNVSGTLAFGGGGTFYLDRDGKQIASIPGSYTLATFGAITGTDNLADWDIDSSDFLFTGDTALDTVSVPGTLRIDIISADIDLLHWQGGGGVWDSATVAWIRRGAPSAWRAGALAVFSTGSGTVNVTGRHTIFGLQFDTDGYILDGTGTLAAPSPVNINTTAANATATINTAFETAGLYKAGSGSVVFGGLATLTGGAIVDEGSLGISPAGTLTAPAVEIASGTNTTATINVAGLLNATDTLTVGVNGTGVLSIASTGIVTVGGSSSIGNAAGSRGAVSIAGELNVAGVGYLGNAAGALGVITVESGGYYGSTGAIRLGAVASGSGILRIENGGVVRTNGGVNVGMANGYGELHIATGGTLFVDVNTAYVGGNAGAANAASYGLMNIDGFFQSATNGTYYFPVGYSGTGVANIGATGTVFAGQMDIGREATATGSVTLAGYYKANAGTTLVGSNGNGTLVIKSGGYFNNSGLALTIGNGATGVGSMTVEAGGAVVTGTLSVGNNGSGTLSIVPGGVVSIEGLYRQNQNSTLAINVATARTDAYITTGSASLSGTLALTGASLNYTPVAKASELPDAGILIITATSGGIHGNFAAVTGFGGGTPDYIVPGGNIRKEANNTTTYRAGYSLAWNAMSGAHGTFTLAEGETFEVDTPLADRFIDTAPGWDKKSLTKLGAGTLILSGENTFTGAVTIGEGTLRLGGPAHHSYGALVNNGVFDFGPAPAEGGNYRTVQLAGLSGAGAMRMTVNPGTGESDRLAIRGDAAGNHQLILAASADATAPGGGSPAPVLVSITGSNNASFTGGLDYNGTNYAVARSAAGNIILATNGEASVGGPIRGIPSSQSLMWFSSQDNLSRRLGELRVSDAVLHRYSVWLRARAEHAELGSDADMHPFDMDLFGFEVGTDMTSMTLPSARIVVGIYAGYGHARQDFDPRAGTGDADGTSDQLGLGFYAAWLHDAGWFANFTFAGTRYDNEFTSRDQSGNRTRGDYKDNALGASAEFGKRIALDNLIATGWFIEPSAQISCIRLMRGDYSTTGANRLDVGGSNADIARLRGMLRAGRVWRQMEIAARAGASYETSSGGEVVYGADRWRPNVDGTRAEAGIGLLWRPTAAGQLYFDYEFATGDSYEKPWSFSLGYRHAF